MPVRTYQSLCRGWHDDLCSVPTKQKVKVKGDIEILKVQSCQFSFFKRLEKLRNQTWNDIKHCTVCRNKIMWSTKLKDYGCLLCI